MSLEATSKLPERVVVALSVLGMVIFVPAAIVLVGVGICAYMVIMITMEFWRILSDVFTSPLIWLAAVLFALLSALVL